jgi:acyl dehydratase
LGPEHHCALSLSKGASTRAILSLSKGSVRKSVSVASMAITEAHAGRRYSLSHPYHVSAAKIAEFATALGDDNPRYRGDSPVAPPTFAAVISAQAWNQMFADPELELALERIVHGDQRFTFFRPLRAGDVVIATAMIDKVRIRAGSELISATVEIAGRDAEPICTAQATFSHAREAAA